MNIDFKTIKRQLYDPKTALVLMRPEQRQVGEKIANELRSQGIDAVVECDDIDGAVLANMHDYDVLVTGEGRERIAHDVETSDDKRYMFTVVVSNNGTRADMKLKSAKDVLRYAQSGWVTEHYRKDDLAQTHRAIKDIKDYGLDCLTFEDMANLENTFMSLKSQ